MSSSSLYLIPEKDAIGMVSVLSKVVSTEGELAEKKQVLMDGLCDLVGADFWIWGLVAGCAPEKPLVYTSLRSGGFTPKQLSKLLVSLENEALSLSFRKILNGIVESGSQVTQLPQDSAYFSTSENETTGVNWSEVDLSPPLICFRPVANGGISKIRLYRRWDSECFSQHHSRIIDIILGEVGWMHELGWTPPRPVQSSKLPKRSRMVLDLLLEGLTRKQIADRISLSIHTVNDHIKRIYSVYSVHSHAELLNRIHNENRTVDSDGEAGE